jgi:hypothetical protein
VIDRDRGLARCVLKGPSPAMSPAIQHRSWRTIVMSRLSTLAGLTAILLSACATDGVDAPADDHFVFGLTAGEILAAKRVAQRPMSDAEWLDAHRGDFSCDRHGDLCAKIGPDAAADSIELGYRLAIDGADHGEVVAAQRTSVEEARRLWRDVEVATYNSDTEIDTGSGANSRRLKATVWATEMWPSLELEADGECRTQKNAFGWVAMNSDQICGEMTATFNGSTVVRWSDCDFDDNVAEFASAQRAAASLVTEINCSAEEGGWSAEQFADVSW